MNLSFIPVRCTSRHRAELSTSRYSLLLLSFTITLLAHTHTQVFAKRSAKSDFYGILGISKSASQSQIKGAFRELSKKYHPDKSSGDEAMFVKVSEAYEVLYDKKLRRIYDRHGLKGIENHRKGEAAGGQAHGGSIFDHFFGGAHHQEEHRGQDINVDLVVTLNDVYNGQSMEVLVQGLQICHHCRGSGAHSPDHVKKCSSCGGKGAKIVNRMVGMGMYQRIQQVCDKCGGHGHKITKKCSHCHGDKVIIGQKILDVFVERGVRDGTTVIFENEGDESPDEDAGHVIFTVKCVQHSLYRRDGHDLHMDLSISLLDSLIGFEKNFPHLDEHMVQIKRSGITKPMQKIRVRGEGMPHVDFPSRFGDMIAYAAIKFPTQLSPEQIAVIDSVLPK